MSILGSAEGKFTKVKVSDCNESTNSCVLKRHSNATIGLDFSLSKFDFHLIGMEQIVLINLIAIIIFNVIRNAFDFIDKII